MRASITIRTVQALQPGQAIWDVAVRGFGCRRQKDAPTYIVKYRFGGRQRFITIGSHGRLTPDQARRRAKGLLGQVAAGQDPAPKASKAPSASADTVGAVIEEYLRAASATLRWRSLREARRYLRQYWAPLHATSIYDVRRRHVADRVSEIERESGAQSAVCARAALGSMFGWALRQGYEIAGNPVSGSNRPTTQSRKRVLSDAELSAIWRDAGDDDYGRIVRLLVLTGCRREEVGSMAWAEIDGDRWTISAERCKNGRAHSLPLPAAALALLPAKKGEFVFGLDRGFTAWSASKARLDARSGIAPWRLHDLRRTAATRMADLGVLPHVIEAVLNHVSGHRAGVAGVYNRATYTVEMREALARWADHVAKITDL